MFRKRFRALPRLPFPTRVDGQEGGEIPEYVLPEEERARVLDYLYPFEPVPGLDEWMFDLHEEKLFRIREFRVFRGEDMDLLASPYFPKSGGTVIDWVPPDLKPGEMLERKIRGESLSVLTVRLAGKERVGHG
jgi:hypothetical protein